MSRTWTISGSYGNCKGTIYPAAEWKRLANCVHKHGSTSEKASL